MIDSDMVDGFVKKAVELGYTDEAIAILFKVAMAACVSPTNELKDLVTKPVHKEALERVIKEIK